MRIVDRYLLKEMALPFVLALVGFLIFILLFLLGQFSRLMVERIITPDVLALLLLYRLPYLLVLALPVATLFAIFLALGRLSHDRELIALQASGLSLRRLLIPLLVVGLILSGVDLFISDRLAPWGNQRYLNLLLEQLYGGRSTPQIRDNAFFKGVEERFFFVRRHDPERNLLEDVLIYDLSGTLRLQNGEAFPKIITAKTATWEDDLWRLHDGVIHAFDSEGNLTYKSRFEAMTIHVGATIQRLAFEQRTPSEMSLGELSQRISDFRKIGRPAEGLIVEYHLKIAIPLACFVFALFGAPLSLLIGPRGRALGVILAVILVLIYQGVLFWTAQILGTRGDLPPAWGAWLPNVIFGLIGVVLFLRADRLGRIDLPERLRRLIPLALALLLPLGLTPPAAAQDKEGEPAPIEVSAESLTISEGWGTIIAQGGVKARYHEGSIEAELLRLVRASTERWELEARAARFSNGEISGSARKIWALLVREEGRILPREITLVQSASVEFPGGRLTADRLTLIQTEDLWEVEAQGEVLLQQEAQRTQAAYLRLRLLEDPNRPNSWLVQGAMLEGFVGETDFVNSRGERHKLRFSGKQAQLTFDEDNSLSLIDITEGDFTTCTCQEAIPQAAYSIRAARLFIRPEEVLAAFGITLRAFGLPILWAPVYVAPLGDMQQKYPFIPEIGRAAGRGWFAKWRIPIFADEETFGFLLLDYYTRYSEVGSGLDLSYRLLPGSSGGRLSFYRLVGRDESLSLDWSERLKLEETTRLDLTAALRTGLLAQEATRLVSGATLSGGEDEWSWRLSFSRDQHLLGPEPDPEMLQKLSYLALERLPELAISKRAVRLWDLPLSYSGGLEWGRYREEALDGTSKENSRFDGRIQAGLEPIRPLPGVELRAHSSFRLSLYELAQREAWEHRVQLGLRPLSSLNVSLDYLYRSVRGRSPFSFDRLSVSNRITLRGGWSFGPQGDMQLGTGYDWTLGGFDPLSLSLSYRLGVAQLSLGLLYEIDEQFLRSVTLQGSAAYEGRRLSLSGGYDFTQARYEDLIAKVDLGPPLKMGLRFDPNSLALRRVNLESGWQLGEWELKLQGEYDLGLGRFTALRFGIIKKFCNSCWQIGLYGGPKELWVQARINAFPTAEIGYSPTDRTLSFGQ